MGSGIAQISVDNAKYRVFLKDAVPEGLARGEAAIDKAMKAKLKKRMTNHSMSLRILA